MEIYLLINRIEWIRLVETVTRRYCLIQSVSIGRLLKSVSATADGWIAGNNRHYPGLGIARFTLNDRGSELPRENTIRSKFPRELRDRSSSSSLRLSLPPPPSPSLVFIFFFLAQLVLRAPLDSRFRRETGREPTGWPTLVSSRECDVTCCKMTSRKECEK